jgi:hypothetical protein
VSESFFERCQFRHAPQLSYSHDVGPCDFFLFGHLEAKLGGEAFETLEQLQERVEEIPGQITPRLMERVYRHWIDWIKYRMVDKSLRGPWLFHIKQ